MEVTSDVFTKSFLLLIILYPKSDHKYSHTKSRNFVIRQDGFATSSPGPSLQRFSKWRIVGRRPWLGHVVQNLQKSWRFLSRDILRKDKTKWRRSIAWEAKYRSKNSLTLYTRQWWLRSKIKYYFNGCFDSGAGRFSICKFIPLSYSLYF